MLFVNTCLQRKTLKPLESAAVFMLYFDLMDFFFWYFVGFPPPPTTTTTLSSPFLLLVRTSLVRRLPEFPLAAEWCDLPATTHAFIHPLQH